MGVEQTDEARISVSQNGTTVNHLVLDTTPPPTPSLFWSFEIKDLADDVLQVFEFKGVACKVFIKHRVTSVICADTAGMATIGRK